MRVGIVTDSTCDLPRAFLDRHNVIILPITIQYDNQTLVDMRDPVATRKFTENMNIETECESFPFTKDEIKDLFLKKLVLDYDFVICLTVASSRSQIHANAKAASYAILTEYKAIREKHNMAGLFQVRVIDTKQLFPGQGVIVSEVIRQLKSGVTPIQALEVAKSLAEKTQAYLMPAGLSHLRKQANKKGDKSVSLMSYVLGSTLDIKPIIRAYQGDTKPVGKVRGFETGTEKLFKFVSQQIQKGLSCPQVCISYGGDPSVVQTFKGFSELAKIAKENRINILISEMGTTWIVNIGPNALGIAFAADRLDEI